jgi:putative sigma-54 modulation protein
MNINIKTTNISLTPAISEYIDKRMEKISKLVESDPTIKCDLEVGRTTSHHNKGDVFKAEIHIVGSHKNAYASAEETDLYSAIDIVRDDIVRSLTGAKEKYASRLRRGGARVKGMMKGLWPWK